MNEVIGTVKKVTKNNNVLVDFDNGNSAEISAHKWEKKEYKVVLDAETGENKIIENVIGEFIQLPLKLAYAVTIHKSQGTTLDKVILNPHTFTAGQLYVALSRVKNIQDLYLTRPLRPGDLKSNIIRNISIIFPIVPKFGYKIKSKKITIKPPIIGAHDVKVSWNLCWSLFPVGVMLTCPSIPFFDISRTLI